MPNIQIKIKNLPQIKAAFAKAPRLMGNNLSKAINLATLNIGRQATRNAPVDTGRLRASMLGGAFKGGSFAAYHGTTLSTNYTLRATIEPNVEYATYVHEGTKYMRARPFLRRAVESQEGEVNKYFEDAVKDTLNAIGRAT